MATEQHVQAGQAAFKTVQAIFGQHLDDQVVRTVFEADQTQDFALVSDVLWELLPEVGRGSSQAAAAVLQGASTVPYLS